MESTDFAASVAGAMASSSSASFAAAAAQSSSPLQTVTHVVDNAANATSFFSSISAKDVVLGPFRLMARVDNALFNRLPRFVGRATGIQRAATAVARYWGGRGGGMATGALAGDGIAAAGQAVGEAAASAGVLERGWGMLITEAFQTSTFRSYWGMAQYVMSRWAFVCTVMALILNRLSVYGAPRQRVILNWPRQLALRLVPILLLSSQFKGLLQAIRCQTSPDFAVYRHGDAMKYSLLDWNQDGGPAYHVSSALTWWQDDQGSCAAVGLSRPEPEVRAPFGSFSLLWPTFLKLCLSHCVESFSLTLQQLPTTTEVGMTVFEHSLAFAEAETMITHALGLNVLNASRTKNATTNAPRSKPVSNHTIPASSTILAITDGVHALTGPHILDRVNVPVEVLLVALLSCGNALFAHIISVAGQQKRLRLINTGFWGICFMSTFVWGFFTTSRMVRSDSISEPKAVSGLLHFPTVAIVGFLPHMAILLGVLICAIIYVIALTLTAISLGTNPNIRQPSSLSERLSIAHDNLQAAISIKGLKVRMSEDFYTALLRLGFAALTAASEAVFLNEGRAVEMKRFTWLEEERLDEFDASKGSIMETPGAGDFQIAEEYGLPPAYPGGSDKGGAWQSGYSRERKFDKKESQLKTDGTFVYPNPRTGGVGVMQRTARFYLLFIFMRGIFFTVGGWIGFGIGACLDSLGLTARPAWLGKIVGASMKKMLDEQQRIRGKITAQTIDFWMITDEGKLSLPASDDLDIEPVMRKRLMIDTTKNLEEILDERMYDWWRIGGWFGSADHSGDYQPPTGEDEDDTTSMISMSTNASTKDMDSEQDWDTDSDGRRTPTQRSVDQSWSFSGLGRNRSATPDEVADNPLDVTTLARLLNPTDARSRDEARVLSAHLASGGSGDRIVTRSRYRQLVDGERSRVLLAGRTPIQNISSPSNSIGNQPRPLTDAEEAEVLETLLIARRTQKTQENKARLAPGTEDDDINRQAGPPCVVCQTQPRTIIAWPCRCLCLCEECRVSLAMNNFGNCVTCRRNVGGFVRLYVP